VFNFVHDDDEACADSGATHIMLPDYSAFPSYHRVAGRTVTLGDNTQLRIAGIGSAKFSLNGKVILVRGALHVPDLRGPLYSLRKHKSLPGCGTFSHYDVGSYILFPTFALRIDDSVDNVVSYRSIGRRKSAPLDYAQPRTATPSARPTHLVPRDDDDDDDAGVPDDASAVVPTPPPPTPTPDDLVSSCAAPLTSRLLRQLHPDLASLPPVPPSATAAPCEHRTSFDSLKLHKIFGFRRFRNQRLLTAASSNATLVHTGEFPTSLGDFATIVQSPAGKTIKKRRKYLDKVHLDIVYGDCVSLGGFRYALVLVDVATRYCWLYGLTSLTSRSIVSALETFRSDAGAVPRTFHADFDKKLIGGKALKWIVEQRSRIIAAPAGRQSSNGLVERTWRTLVQMARAYITDKQVGREFWYYAILHASRMLNQIPGRLGRKLTTPFELVHNHKPDARTWLQPFSLGFFSRQEDNTSSRSNTEDQALVGIAIGRDDKTNAVTFYNPITRSYYRPPTFHLDESALPATLFPKHIRYDGGLTSGLLRNRTDPVPEPFPPGTRVTIGAGDSSQRGTVQNIPQLQPTTVSTASDDCTSNATPGYVILLDDGTTTEVSFEDLTATAASSHTADETASDPFEDLPHFLQRHSKLTMDHHGAFHKGYLQHSVQGGFVFEVRRNLRSTKVDFTIPLPNFVRQWTTLVGDDTIIPGHSQVSSFLRPKSSNNAPSANFVSAKNLLSPCPVSLLRALHPSNPDRDIWLASYREEKGGLEQHDVYERINKKTYLALRRKGLIPKALPSMCVLVVKSNKDGSPHRAKSRIVVLGNHEERYFSKSDRYAPVLQYSSLRLLVSKAIGDKRVLQQGDCKNAFCQATLPDDERVVVRPPIGDPAYKQDELWFLKKTLYGLRRSPRHWYQKFTNILREMGLRPTPNDPCLFEGVVSPVATPQPQHDAPSPGTPHRSPAPATDPDSPQASPPDRAKVYVGMYVDDFVFYSTDDAEEARFKKELAARITVDFMGDVDYFLGTAFTWKRREGGHLSVHLSQAAFTDHTAHRFGVDRMNPVPNMTPWRSGLPIDSIANPDPEDPDLKRRTKVYQGIVGSINWLATCTRPDIAPALTFLATYNQSPSSQHYKSAIHALKYLYSTSTYGISFHSDADNTLHAYNHFPHHHDREAYDDATPPSPGECHQLTAYSDACWGSQIGNSVPEGTPLELFKFRSLSGYLICRSGGPIAWKSIRQQRTSQSSCEAEIVATNECVKDIIALRNRGVDLDMSDALPATQVYNDNQAAVDWVVSLTNKGTKHINLRETSVREAHLDSEVAVHHIPGKINPADIFTKEMKDDAHFRRLRDCFMVSHAAFLKYGRAVPSNLVSSQLCRDSQSPDCLGTRSWDRGVLRGAPSPSSN